MTNNKPNSFHQSSSSSSRYAKLDASYTDNLKKDMSTTTTTTTRSESSSSSGGIVWPRLVFRFQWNGWMIQPAPSSSSFSRTTTTTTTSSSSNNNNTTRFPTGLYYQNSHHHRPVSTTKAPDGRQKTCTQWLDEYDDFFFESDV